MPRNNWHRWAILAIIIGCLGMVTAIYSDHITSTKVEENTAAIRKIKVPVPQTVVVEPSPVLLDKASEKVKDALIKRQGEAEAALKKQVQVIQHEARISRKIAEDTKKQVDHIAAQQDATDRQIKKHITKRSD